MRRIAIGFLLFIISGSIVKAQDFKKVRTNLLLAQAGALNQQKLDDAN